MVEALLLLLAVLAVRGATGTERKHKRALEIAFVKDIRGPSTHPYAAQGAPQILL